jgi:hypothetical protein
MQSGATRRNLLIGLSYLVAAGAALVIIVLLIPLLATVTIGSNYRGSADRLARLPGIQAGGGVGPTIAAFSYGVVLISLLFISGAGTGEPMSMNQTTETNMGSTMATPSTTSAATDTQASTATTAAKTSTPQPPATTTATATPPPTPTATPTPEATPTPRPTPTTTVTPTPESTPMPTPEPTPTSTPPSTPESTPPPEPTESEEDGAVVTPTPSHDGDLPDPYDCGDFDTRAQVEAVFDPNNDVSDLDSNGDGVACESIS